MQGNPNKHPAHAQSTGRRDGKTRNAAPFACGKTWQCFKKVTGQEIFQHVLFKLKAPFLRHMMRKTQGELPYVPYVLMSEWTYLGLSTKDERLTRPLVNRLTGQLVNRLTGQLVNWLPGQLVSQSTRQLVNRRNLFSKKFNTKSTLFVRQPPTLPQKIDSREGLFRCPKGVVVHAGKMNFYLNQPPLTPVFGLFAAKYSAFWC